MSLIASDIGTVPSRGFKWYLIFLEEAYEDEIRNQIDTHFSTLGRETGKDVLVVRGYDPTRFRKSAVEAPAFHGMEWRNRVRFPALLVTNCPPNEAVVKTDILAQGKVMVFALKDIFQEHKSLAAFFTDLTAALYDEDAIKALENLEPTSLQRTWGWLSRYSKMEPGFFGFNIKVDRAVKDLVARTRGKKA